MQSPNLSLDENRIAQAVTSAVMRGLDSRFIAFEQKMDKRFTDHMTELETYYSNHYSELLAEVRNLRQDYQKVFDDESG